MANMNIKSADLEELTGMDREKLVETLTELGAPTEPDGEELAVEVTPNRPDLFFVEGLARAVRAYAKKEKHHYSAEKSDYEAIVEKSVKKARPFVGFAVVKGAKLDGKGLEYLINAQEKLHGTIGRKRKKVAIGIHDLSKVEFPLFYKAVENISFVPLDYSEEMTAKEILEKHPKGKEYAHLIDGLFPVILDKNGVISLPPIINSERTRLTGQTTDYLIDVTGTHEETVAKVLDMIVCALADRGGKIYSVSMGGKAKSPDLKYGKVKPKLSFVNKILGLKLKEHEVPELLKRMDYAVEGKDILAQPYRADIMHQVDVVEDIAIAYGYRNFEPTLPQIFTVGGFNRKPLRIQETMKGMGFMEIKTTVLNSEENMRKTGQAERCAKVLNTKTEENALVRRELLTNMLIVFAENKTRGTPQKLYEIGEVYDSGKSGKKLSVGIMDERASFADIRACIETYMKENGAEFSVEPNTDADVFDTQKSAALIVDGKRVGTFGEVSADALSGFGIGFKVSAAEITLDF
ncbi:MAG: phenylalanine--tRNA ligase subunit beta [Candidatus Bilamarchaeaceae archaeon]